MSSFCVVGVGDDVRACSQSFYRWRCDCNERENPKIDKVGISSLKCEDDIDEVVENYLVVLYRRLRIFFLSCWLQQRKNMFTQWSMEEIRRKKMTFSVNAQMRLFFLRFTHARLMSKDERSVRVKIDPPFSHVSEKNVRKFFSMHSTNMEGIVALRVTSL